MPWLPLSMRNQTDHHQYPLVSNMHQTSNAEGEKRGQSSLPVILAALEHDFIQAEKAEGKFTRSPGRFQLEKVLTKVTRWVYFITATIIVFKVTMILIYGVPDEDNSSIVSIIRFYNH
jgi:hypothetical protein